MNFLSPLSFKRSIFALGSVVFLLLLIGYGLAAQVKSYAREQTTPVAQITVIVTVIIEPNTPTPTGPWSPPPTPTRFRITMTPTPTNTPTNTSTPTDTATPTDTPTPTDTVTPTSTPTPTPTDTATPTPKPRDKSNASSSSSTSTPLPDIIPLPSATPTPLNLPYLYNVESGPDGWQATGLWHISTRRSHSPNHAWWYGQENIGNYNINPQPQANSGDLTSPLITLPSGQELILRFATRWQVETARPDRDLRLIQLQDAGGRWQTIRQLNSSGGEEWRASETIDLSAYAGQVVRVRFHFDTVDGEANAFEGWWVDDVVIEGGTPPSYLPETGGIITP